MEISIRDVGAKPAWLAKVAAFLHDASVPYPAGYDARSQTFSLTIQRIGYEFRVKRQALFLTIWRMPFVPAVLTVTPVVLLTPEEKPGDRWDMDQLLDIEMPAPPTLEFKTREGVIGLRLVGPATLTLRDSGPPESRLANSMVGGLIIQPELITEIVNTPVA
jgi:hypothetical protein